MTEPELDCGCVWERRLDFGDVLVRPCGDHRPLTEFERLMGRYAQRALDIELDYVVRAKRTVAAEPCMSRLIEILAGELQKDPSDVMKDPDPGSD